MPQQGKIERDEFWSDQGFENKITLSYIQEHFR